MEEEFRRKSFGFCSDLIETQGARSWCRRPRKMFRGPDGLQQRRHVLVIGAPRSGTTLLATIIGRHSEVGMMNEDITGRGLRKVLGRTITGNKLCIPNQIQLERASRFGWRWLKKLGVVGEAPRSQYSITDYLQLPKLKVVAIIRHGNDSISSMMVRGKSKLKKAVRRWAEAIETIGELKRSYADRLLVVNFEDLVLSPEKTVREICRFLEINFEAQMLDGYLYNAKYPETRFNAEKAYRCVKENRELGVEVLAPAAVRIYENLLSGQRRRRAPKEVARKTVSHN